MTKTSSHEKRALSPAPKTGDFLRRHRAREEIALGVPAAQGAQKCGLFLGLYALGDHGEAERMRHLDDGAHDRGIPLVARQVLDEGTVDLERRNREAGE